jgi:hypothetical protein
MEVFNPHQGSGIYRFAMEIPPGIFIRMPVVLHAPIPATYAGQDPGDRSNLIKNVFTRSQKSSCPEDPAGGDGMVRAELVALETAAEDLAVHRVHGTVQFPEHSHGAHIDTDTAATAAFRVDIYLNLEGCGQADFHGSSRSRPGMRPKERGSVRRNTGTGQRRGQMPGTGFPYEFLIPDAHIHFETQMMAPVPGIPIPAVCPDLPKNETFRNGYLTRHGSPCILVRTLIILMLLMPGTCCSGYCRERRAGSAAGSPGHPASHSGPGTLPGGDKE